MLEDVEPYLMGLWALLRKGNFVISARWGMVGARVPVQWGGGSGVRLKGGREKGF